MNLQIHPRDTPNSSAKIYPEMEVFIPEVDAVMAEMVGTDLGLLAGVTRGTTWQSIDMTSCKAEKGSWYIYQRESVPPIVEDIQKFIERWTMPLLDNYTSAAEVFAAGHSNTGPLLHDRAQLLRVVVAALICNEKERARALMETWLGATFIRKRYQQVYDFIENYT